MRERLVAILVGLTVAVVGLYGIPRAYFVADLVHEFNHLRDQFEAWDTDEEEQ